MIKNLLLAFTLFSFLQASAILHPVVDSIPMRDGKKLAADVYIPAGLTSGPVILIQTPYNRQNYRLSLPLQIGTNVDISKYVFVIADWRGFYGSAAAAVALPNYGKDGYDCVEWIAQQSFSNGKIGTWGASALGRVQFQTAEQNPPHLVCICPLVSGSQYSYEQYYPNGDLRTEYIEQLDALGYGLQAGIMANQLYNNTWQYLENANFYPDSIRVPCYMIGGWYDMNIKDMLTLFSALQTQSPVNVQATHRLLMGPWSHGTVGNPVVGQLTFNAASHWSDSLALAFFDYYLRNDSNNWNHSPVIQYFQMGENTWHQTSSWPPAGPNLTNFYMHADGSLNNEVPTNTVDSVSYNYDPTNPSPTYGGPTLRNDLKQGPYNQFDTIEGRNDIAIFTTGVLPANVVMQGNAVLHLKVSSNRFDTDFDVRLTDVYNDSTSIIVNDGCMRMRFLNGATAADTNAIIPGRIYDCTITLPATCITFLAGHRIRVDITSSNYPRFNRNMNTDGVMYPNKNMDTLVNPLVASNTVYTNNSNTSYIALPLVDYATGIKDITAAGDFVSVYPKPAGNQLWVSTTYSEGKMKLYDVDGKIVLSQPLTGNTNMVNVSNIAAGIYLLSIETTDKVLTQKISLQK